jgi:predicted nucleotidyltransferase
MNKIAVSKEIENIKRAIIEKYAPERIILFGSYAYGNPDKDSDVDFLIVLHFKGKGTYKALEIIEKIKPTIPIDLIVRTPKQIKTRIAQNDFFLREILTKGKVIYEASH